MDTKKHLGIPQNGGRNVAGNIVKCFGCGTHITLNCHATCPNCGFIDD